MRKVPIVVLHPGKRAGDRDTEHDTDSSLSLTTALVRQQGDNLFVGVFATGYSTIRYVVARHAFAVVKSYLLT